MPPQCQGRRTTPKAAPLFFENGPRLHRNKPLSFLGIVRCVEEAEDLCISCLERQKSTEYQLVKRAGKYIPNQETMFHGRIGEPIPDWSRLQGGAWFLAQIAAGYEVKGFTPSPVEMSESEAAPKKVVVRRKKVVKPVEEIPVEIPVAAPAPAPAPTKKPRAKKVVVKQVVEVTVPPPVVAPTTKKFRPKKAEPVQKPKPIIGVVEQAPMEDITIVKVVARKTEIGGRALYVSGKKDKVYDLKFKYIGRWNRREDKVDTTYPDSDAEP